MLKVHLVIVQLSRSLTQHVLTRRIEDSIPLSTMIQPLGHLHGRLTNCEYYCMTCFHVSTQRPHQISKTRSNYLFEKSQRSTKKKEKITY